METRAFTRLVWHVAAFHVPSILMDHSGGAYGEIYLVSDFCRLDGRRQCNIVALEHIPVSGSVDRTVDLEFSIV